MLFRSIRGLQWDDWIMGLFVTTAFTALLVVANRWLKVQSNLEPSDFEFSALSAYELSRRRYGSKLVVVVEQTQIAVIWSCKTCLLIMYHRITRTALRNENLAIKLLSAYVALGFVVIEILYFAAWCRPFSEYYAVPTSSSQCNALINHRITKAIFNISSDLFMLSIALQMLIRSLLPIKRKLVLCGIFSLGIFVVLASIMNSYYSLSSPYRHTWIDWYVRESSTAILVANLPFTWTILRRCFEIGDFDETNPPRPWTYYPTHTTGSRKTSVLLQTHSTGGRTITRCSHNNTNGSRAMTLVNSNTLHKSPTNSNQSDDTEKELLGEAIRPRDWAPVVLRTGSYGIIDLESGLVDEANQSSLCPNQKYQRNRFASDSPTITEEGTGGFYDDDHPIPAPSRAHVTVSAS
jgi:hypothetical protein